MSFGLELLCEKNVFLLVLLPNSTSMMRHWVCLLLLLWSFANATTETEENEESQKKKTEMSQPTMAPNSKFLNPHVDDDTNLQFAVAAFADDAERPEGTKSKAAEILSKFYENWGDNVSTREPKSLDEWKLIPYLNSLIKRSNNYKLKNF